jgi:hypothetical protein
MKKKVFLFIFLAFLLVLPVVNARQGNSLAVGLFKDIGATLGEIFEFLSYEVTIPHPREYGYEDERVTLLQFFGVFGILYAVFWAAINRTKLFKSGTGNSLRPAKIAFTISLTLLVIFVSPITEWIFNWVGTLTFIGLILAIFVLIMFMAHSTKRGLRGVGSPLGKLKNILKKADNQSDRIQGSEQSIQERVNEWLGDFDKLKEEESLIHELVNKLISVYNNSKGNFDQMKNIALDLETALKGNMKDMVKMLRDNKDVYKADRRIERLNQRLSKNYEKQHRYLGSLLADLNKTIADGQGKLDANKLAELSEYNKKLNEKMEIAKELKELQGSHIQNERKTTINFANRYKDILNKIDKEIEKFINIVKRIIENLDKAKNSNVEKEITSSLNSIHLYLIKIIELFKIIHEDIIKSENLLETISTQNKQDMAIMDNVNDLEGRMESIKSGNIAVNLNSAKAIVYDENKV